jgi:hypothetical protein
MAATAPFGKWLSDAVDCSMSLPPAHKALHTAFARVLSNEHYKGRWHSLQTLQRLGNQFAPAGLVLNKFTVQNAFSISDAEYHFSDQLIDELSSPEGTNLAVRWVHHQDATSPGYFTVVGCFHINQVQLLYPTLKQLGVLCMLSDFVNCILHAFNLSYEHACKDALGDQGMNCCTVFQRCYFQSLENMCFGRH